MDTAERSEQEALRGSLRRSVLLPQDADCKRARKVWNAMIDKRPTLLVCGGGYNIAVSAPSTMA